MLCKWKVKGDTERLPTSVECTRKKEGNGEMTEKCVWQNPFGNIPKPKHLKTSI